MLYHNAHHTPHIHTHNLHAVYMPRHPICMHDVNLSIKSRKWGHTMISVVCTIMFTYVQFIRSSPAICEYLQANNKMCGGTKSTAFGEALYVSQCVCACFLGVCVLRVCQTRNDDQFLCAACANDHRWILPYWNSNRCDRHWPLSVDCGAGRVYTFRLFRF